MWQTPFLTLCSIWIEGGPILAERGTGIRLIGKWFVVWKIRHPKGCSSLSCRVQLLSCMREHVIDYKLDESEDSGFKLRQTPIEYHSRLLWINPTGSWTLISSIIFCLIKRPNVPSGSLYTTVAERERGDMFQTPLTTGQKAAVRSCILYSTTVPVHLHLHLFKIKVALKDNNMHRFSMFTQQGGYAETWAGFLHIGTRFRNKCLSLVDDHRIKRYNQKASSLLNHP